jgi:hypothetical protein
MLTYTPNDDQDHVILFGTAGWSSWFMASFKELDDRTRLALWSRAERLLPDNIRKTHPGNSDVSWIRIYKFTKELKHDDI